MTLVEFFKKKFFAFYSKLCFQTVPHMSHCKMITKSVFSSVMGVLMP